MIRPSHCISSVLLLLAVFSNLFMPNVHAFPSVAGHCESGDQVMKDIPQHGNNGSGRLSFAGYRVYLNGDEISRQSTTTLAAGVDHVVSLRATSNWPFKGFMLRLSNPDTDVSSAFEVTDSANSQLNPQCFGSNEVVSSVCHNDNDEKNEIDMKLRFDTSAALLLDVTVVRSNSPQGSDLWYYDYFNINIGDPGTPSPTASPTPNPTPSPTPPVGNPTASPTTKAPSNGEDPNAQFVLRLRKSDNTPFLRTCGWLQDKSRMQKHKICTLPKHSKSSGDYGPAKDVCTETCAPYPCRPDKWKKFVWNIEKSGKVVLQRCTWLRRQTKPWKKNKACTSEVGSGKYKPASQVCYTTCCDY